MVFCCGSEGSGHKGMTLKAQNGENNQRGKTCNTKESPPLTDWCNMIFFNSPFTMETLNMITEVKFKKKGKKTRASSHETTSLFSLKDQRFDLK